MMRARSTVTVITALGIGLAACDDGPDNVGPDGPALDGPVDGEADGPVDGPPVDGPPVDGPVDGPPVDAPVDGGSGLLGLSVEGTGAGVIYNDPLTQWCANEDCAEPFTRPLYQTYRFRQEPIAGSTFMGWSGCTPQPDGSCAVYLEADTVVTATYAAPPEALWVRSAWPLYIAEYPIFLDATADGVVASGTGRDYAGGGAWTSRYLADGTQTSDDLAFFDPLLHPAVAHGVNAAGTHWFAVAEPPPPFPPGQEDRLLLRRVAQPAVSVAPGGFVSTHALAVDATGNAYVSGVVDGVPYLASYDLAGAERWRVTPTGVLTIHTLVVRGDLLVAGGTAIVGPRRDGWLATFDLAGAPGWSRTITVPNVQTDLTFSALALDSDGDIIYGGLDRTTTSYVAGSVSADGATEHWQRTFSNRTVGALATHTDDTIRLWLNATGPSTLLTLDESGTQTAAQPITLPTPAALLVSPSGTTFLAGPHNPTGTFAARRPAILSIPAP